LVRAAFRQGVLVGLLLTAAQAATAAGYASGWLQSSRLARAFRRRDGTRRSHTDGG
jgi:hypothetical protein